MKCIRRPNREGFKAGNVNAFALTVLAHPVFVLLDADQAVEPRFLERTMPWLWKPEIAFVQSRQAYRADASALAEAASHGLSLFYGAVGRARSLDDATPMCGTNVVVRTEAFRAVGGFAHYTATEDIDLGVRLRAAGYSAAYVGEGLAEGIAPPNLAAFKRQQRRWANGNVAVLMQMLPRLMDPAFTPRFVFHFLYSVLWWFVPVALLGSVLVAALAVGGHPTPGTWLPGGALAWNAVLPWLVVVASTTMTGRVGNVRASLRRTYLAYCLLAASSVSVAGAVLDAVLRRRYYAFELTPKRASPNSVSEALDALAIGGACAILVVLAAWVWWASDSAEARREVGWSGAWLTFHALTFLSAPLLVGTRRSARQRSS